MNFVTSKNVAETTTSQKLINLDLQDSAILVSVEKVDIGYAVRNLVKQMKCSEKGKFVLKSELNNLLIVKTLLKSFLARGPQL